MNEDEKEKQLLAVDEKPLWPFILATLFSLPLLIAAVSYIFNLSLIGYVHLPGINVLTIGPIIATSAGIALVFIIMSLVASPSWCRFILSFYLLVILIILVLLLPDNGFAT